MTITEKLNLIDTMNKRNDTRVLPERKHTWREYIEAMKAKWIGQRVFYEGRKYTVVDVDYNGGLLIDKADAFKDTTSIPAERIERGVYIDR